MKDIDKSGMDRRSFLKRLGAGLAASTALYGCSSESKKQTLSATSHTKEIGEMTYRTSLSGDKVSILGYGCMR